MKSLRHISLGIVIGFLLVLMMGVGAIDKTYYTHNPIFEDGYGFYYGSGSDAQMTWNASGYVDWNVTGDVDMDLTGKFAMDFSAATDSSGGFKVTANVPTGQQLYGAIYGLADIEGTTDGTVTGLRGRISMDSSSAPESTVAGARINIQETGADLDQAYVVGIIIETLLDAGGNDPENHFMMRFNTSQGAETPEAWFHAANPEAVAWTANVVHTGASTDKVGAIAVRITGSEADPGYIYVYDHAGQ